MDLDWSATTKYPELKNSLDDVHEALVSFYASFQDPRVETDVQRQALHRLLSILLHSGLSATNKAEGWITVSAGGYPKALAEQLKLDWTDIFSVLCTLTSLGVIELDPLEEDAIRFKLTSLYLSDHEPTELAAPASKAPAKQSADFLSSAAKAESLGHSCPLSVHTWSEHPEVNSFVDAIYLAHFSGGSTTIKKKHLKVLLLDLYLTWCDDPTLKTAVHRDVNAYKPKSRYNALHISKKIIEIIDRLRVDGLLDYAPGTFDKTTGKGFLSRIWPTPALIAQFEAAQFNRFDIDPHTDQECIVLRDYVVKPGSKRRPNEDQVDIEYEDTEHTIAMREQVRAYNDLLRRTFIDIPVLDTPFIPVEDSPDGSHNSLCISQSTKFVRRIFNRGSWDKGGRFSGGWWQNCPKGWRQAIFLNDEPVSEIDYSGLHMVLLYAQQGIDYWTADGTDPYTIDLPDLSLEPNRLRQICKQLILVALNAKSETSAFAAFRDEAETGSDEKHMTNKELSLILSKLKQKHQPIAHKLASDAGIDLMAVDAKIAARIIDHFLDLNIPILTIHDSFIVPFGLEQELESAMKKAFEAETDIASVRLKEVTHNPYSMEPLNEDDATTVSPEIWEEMLQYRLNPPRSKRYNDQHARFSKWLNSNGLSASSSAHNFLAQFDGPDSEY